MSVSMAIVDFIPVCLFLVSMIILQRVLYERMSKGAFALFACGGIMSFVAGFYKATWKLLYALNVCDFEPLNRTFFPMQASGFLILALGLIGATFFRQTKADKALSVAAVPAVYSGTMIFVSMMCLGVIGMSTTLAVQAKRIGQKKAMVLFLCAGFGLLCMGYLSTKDFTLAAMNWAAEVVNIVAQICLLCGANIMKKAMNA